MKTTIVDCLDVIMGNINVPILYTGCNYYYFVW